MLLEIFGDCSLDFCHVGRQGAGTSSYLHICICVYLPHSYSFVAFYIGWYVVRVCVCGLRSCNQISLKCHEKPLLDGTNACFGVSCLWMEVHKYVGPTFLL